MSGRMYARLVHLSLVLLLSGAGGAACQAANPGQSDINMNDLSILEHRFFSHAYAHDPAEKRLERLECLVFGSTREGSNTERMTRLLKTVATRSQQPLAQEKSPPPPSAAGAPQPADKPPSSSKQYPILSTLEWKALKKTFPNESLDQRLDRLESKMFGQPAQSMAYVDRVERLKKTVGIGISPELNDGITARGPMPKAQARGAETDTGGAMPMPLEGFMPPAMSPLFGGMDPFGDTAFGGMRQMMQSMDRQMAELRRLGPGTWVQDPNTKDWIDMNTRRRVSPQTSISPSPGGKPKATTPGEFDGHILKDVPGYADPNSI